MIRVAALALLLAACAGQVSGLDEACDVRAHAICASYEDCDGGWDVARFDACVGATYGACPVGTEMDQAEACASAVAGNYCGLTYESDIAACGEVK